MADWSTNIAAAPRGRYVLRAAVKGKGHVKTFEPAKVILATKCGIVTVSHYLPDPKRWEMLGVNEQPVAWMPWTGQTKLADLPAHPDHRAAA